jgi:glycerol-3-phosphate dehydrogenase
MQRNGSSRVPHDIGTYPFDVIVVGAGINGAGIARDAAMRDLKVLLIDKGDIASGTTSWSTRLIHGGLRSSNTTSSTSSTSPSPSARSSSG